MKANAVISNQTRSTHHPLRTIAIVLALLSIGVVFYFSVQPANSSKIQSEKVLHALRIFGVEMSLYTVRNLAHLVLYGVVGCVFTFALSFKLNGLKLFEVSFLCASITAILDELHQAFVPGRGSQLQDIGLDMLGAFITIVVSTVLISYIKSKLE